MSPVFQCGDSFFCDASLAPSVGKFILLREKPPWQRGRIILCQLVSFNEREWIVSLLNSGGKNRRAREERLSRAEFPICHRVVSKDFC